MRTLHLSLQLSSLQITTSPPWKQTNPFFPPNFSSIPCDTTSLPTRTFKIQAKAKGFGERTQPESTIIVPDEKNPKQIGGKNAQDEDDKIAPEIWERMIVRILVSVGAPMGSGLALLFILGMLKENHIWDVPLWFPFLTTLLSFGTSAIGIAYGTLSTSLDPNKKGSFFGWEEVEKNWPELWKEDIE